MEEEATNKRPVKRLRLQPIAEDDAEYSGEEVSATRLSGNRVNDPFLQSVDSILCEKALLSQIESNLCHGSRRIPVRVFHLTFSKETEGSSAYIGEPSVASLLLNHPPNLTFFSHYSWLLRQRTFLNQRPFTGDYDLRGHRIALRGRIWDEVLQLDSIKQQAWRSMLVEEFMSPSSNDETPVRVATSGSKLQRLWRDEDLIHATENAHSNLVKNEQFIATSPLLVTILHTLEAAAHLDCAFILSTLRFVLFTCLIHNKVDASCVKRIADSIPGDIRTVLSQLSLGSDVTIYASCPVCCALYPPNSANPHDPYLHKCTAVPDSAKGPCHSTLVKLHTSRQQDVDEERSSGMSYAPVRPFPVQSLRSWVSRLVF